LILVTGGSGLIGSEVLRGPSHAGVPARALTRDLKKAHTLPGVAWVAGDLGKPKTLHAAFDGTTTLFLPTHYLEDMVELQHNAIAAARDAGVTHVVKVSAFAAIYSPSGDGKIPYVDGRDVGAVGVVTLTTPGHVRKKYVLTSIAAKLKFGTTSACQGSESTNPADFLEGIATTPGAGHGIS